MKILVTGAKGQLGSDVVTLARARGNTVIPVDVDEMDLLCPEDISRVLWESKPDAVIHCAAWTQVDAAEDEKNRETVYAVNVLGTAQIAKTCRELNCKLLYLSTDYVFDGEGERAWLPEDRPDPINFYGKTKYLGERAILEQVEKYFIVRISWVFGVNGKNFVQTMLNLGKSRPELNVVSDQIGSPTYTPDLAKLLLDMVETEKYGIYHATNEGYCSWYEFALEIFRLADDPAYRAIRVNPVTSADYPAKAKRPHNSRMSKESLQKAGFERLPSWQDALARYLKMIEAKDAN